MKLPRWWPRPSLVRRTVLALLAAFALAWAALLFKSWADFRREATQQHGLRLVARALAGALEEGGPQGAAWVARATEHQYNALRREAAVPSPRPALLFRVEGADGALVHASAGMDVAVALPPPGGEPVVSVAGQPYWHAQHVSPHWRVQVLEPVITDAEALPLLGRSLVQPMLIAFPFVLLPLWIAVRGGLRPLRTLAQAVARRDPGDCSPLGLQPRHVELRPLVGALEGLLEKARHHVEREKAFVQDAAHELRTPLAVVAAQAHVLAGAASGEERAAARRALEAAVQRASHLVQQLLTLAALDRPGAVPAQPVDVVELARGILIAAAPRAAGKRIELDLSSPDRLDAVLDVPAFHSVLENLLHNACAYCPAGAQVAVRLEADAERLRLEVADDGPGIPAEEQSRVFERFYRGRAGAAAQGSGLGLAIVRQALQRLQGRLELRPGLRGQGVGFAIELPRVPIEAAG